MSDVLSIRLDSDLKTRLDALSKQTRRPVSMYVKEALEEYLEDLEDYYLGIQALEEYRKDPVTYTTDEVLSHFDLEN